MSTAVAEKPATKPKPDRRKAPLASFEIERNDWCEILSDAALFASRDVTLPMLECVHLTVGTHGRVVATATDRFTLGRRVYQLDAKIPAPVEVMVPVREVAAMTKIHAAPARRGVSIPPQVTVTGKLPYVAEHRWGATGGSITVSSGVTGERSVTSTHPCMPVGFVDADRLFEEEAGREAGVAPPVAFNPEYLARFARVSRRRGESMHVRLTTNARPMRITIGEHFTGLVMPVRMPAAEAQS